MNKKNQSKCSAADRVAAERAALSRCVKCGSCRAVCPSFLATRDESFSARGRMALIQAALDGRIEISEIYKDRLQTCTTCAACEAACASGVPVTDIIQAAKDNSLCNTGAPLRDRVISAVLATPFLMHAGARFAPRALHYRPALFERVRAKAGINRSTGQRDRAAQAKRGTVLFFAGCAATYFQPDIALSAIAVIRKLGYHVIVPRDLRCCGRPLLSLGDRRAAERAAEKNTEIFNRERPDLIVTACASCGLTFKKEYPTLLPPYGRLPALLDIHELLARDLDKLELAPVARTITWHDPCHLARGQGLGRTAREILKRIPGITLVEMQDADRCCGFGGIMRLSNSALSNEIADQKAMNIVAANAASVITGCPSCRLQIAEALCRAESATEVLHTVQLMEEAISNSECEIRNAE